MAKEKKLTVKIYENKQLKENQFPGPGDDPNSFYPLYIMITFNRKVKTIKSPTFEFLERTNSAYHLLSSNWKHIQNNDERLLKHFRSFLESSGLEFSVASIAPENEIYQKFKTPIFDLFSREFLNYLHVFFGNRESETNGKFSATQLILYSYPNPIHFFEMMQEMNSELAVEFASINSAQIKRIRIFERLRLIGIIPFYADFQANEPFLSDLSELRILNNRTE